MLCAFLPLAELVPLIQSAVQRRHIRKRRKHDRPEQPLRIFPDGLQKRLVYGGHNKRCQRSSHPKIVVAEPLPADLAAEQHRSIRQRDEKKSYSGENLERTHGRRVSSEDKAAHSNASPCDQIAFADRPVPGRAVWKAECGHAKSEPCNCRYHMNDRDQRRLLRGCEDFRLREFPPSIVPETHNMILSRMTVTFKILGKIIILSF